jgi:hypothetical protein
MPKLRGDNQHLDALEEVGDSGRLSHLLDLSRQSRPAESQFQQRCARILVFGRHGGGDAVMRVLAVVTGAAHGALIADQNV